MTEVLRQDLFVRGKPTTVLTVGPSLSENPENIVLIIPGNPGIASYYREFMQCLYTCLQNTHAIWTVSHAGHCQTPQTSFLPDGNHVYDLQEQIDHKVAFMQDHIPKGAKVTLIGHSIGCYIILNILKVADQLIGVTIKNNYLLFPTVERMKTSPSGVRYWPIFQYFRWLVIFMAACAYVLPDKLKEVILNWSFKDSVEGVPVYAAKCCVQATIELLHPKIIQNVFWMAYNELKQVDEADLETIEKHKDQLFFYYGAEDKWCPQYYCTELQNRVTGVDVQVCSDGFKHAFVLMSSEAMAKKVGEWMVS